MNLLERRYYNNISGIYSISNTIDNRIYIGSTVSLYVRNRQHYNKLKNNKHDNIHLQGFVNKYGINNLIFNIVEIIEDKEKLLTKEQYFIDKYNTYKNGFNLSKDAKYSTLGKKCSDYTKRKISENNKRSKLNYDESILIKKMLNSGFRVKDISEYFKVTSEVISQINNNYTRKYIKVNEKLSNDEYLKYKIIFDSFNTNCKNRLLTDNEISYIKYLKEKNYIININNKNIVSTFFKLELPYLNKIINNKTFINIDSKYNLNIDNDFNDFVKNFIVRNNKTILSNEQVSYIKYLINNNFIVEKYHKKMIIDFFKIKTETLSSFIKNEFYKNIKPEKIQSIDYNFNIFVNNFHINENKLLNNEISYIKYLINNNFLNIQNYRKNIMEFFNINKKCLSDIISNRIYKNIKTEKIIEIDTKFNNYLETIYKHNNIKLPV